MIGFIILCVIVVVVGIIIAIVTDVDGLGVGVSVILFTIFAFFFLSAPSPKPNIYSDFRFTILSEETYELVSLNRFYENAESDEYIMIQPSGEFGYYIYKDNSYVYCTAESLSFNPKTKAPERKEVRGKLIGLRGVFTLFREDDYVTLNLPENTKIYSIH